MQVKAVLFDLDGTILDSVPVILASFRQVCEQMDIGFDEASVKALLGIPLEAQAEIFAGKHAEEFVTLYRKTKACRAPDADMQPFPGANDAIHTLKAHGYRLAVVTSKSLAATNLALNKYGLSDKFEVVVTADHVTHHKPHPEPILKALDDMDLPAHDAVYIGDATFDLRSATSAGVPMIGVTWGAGNPDELAPGCVGMADTWNMLVQHIVTPV